MDHRPRGGPSHHARAVMATGALFGGFARPAQVRTHPRRPPHGDRRVRVSGDGQPS
ncbi:hypothetical protein B005_1373 [Nocardiopsis alba ATCC BAA-2165]|uniref:Uncharacterized protein n=1 Tax=Nocardiopsis alba (strain ATCC BAA-2165 / BE74) TaxID=1205910 RepID=J7KXB0_NOCAA|nr:hypothetical protein B005_1373 [Nocardiopsis alba ATCC BAA-2165]